MTSLKHLRNHQIRTELIPHPIHLLRRCIFILEGMRMQLVIMQTVYFVQHGHDFSNMVFPHVSCCRILFSPSIAEEQADVGVMKIHVGTREYDLPLGPPSGSVGISVAFHA